MEYKIEKINTTKGEIEIKTYEQDGMTLITHNSLKSAIYHQLPSLVSSNFEVCKRDIPVVVCTLIYEGQQISAIAGAHPDTLLNEISKLNPYETAENRAFDRAALTLLGLDGRYYSSEQIQKATDTAGVDNVTSKEEAEQLLKEMDEQAKNNVNETTNHVDNVPEENTTSNDNYNEESSVSEGTPSTSVKTEEVQESNDYTPEEGVIHTEEVEGDTTDPLDVTIQSGPVKGKTWREAFAMAKGQNYVKWLVNNQNLSANAAEELKNYKNIPEDKRPF